MLGSTDCPPITTPHSRKAILVVDDDSQVLESLSFILKAAGYDITSASNGRDAVQLFLNRVEEKDAFDLIITDFGMPGMNGEEVAQQVKSISKDTPVVLLSGWTGQFNASADNMPCVDVVLGKPPKRKDLIEAIEKF